MVNLSDPTLQFLKYLRIDTRKKGHKIAKELFDGDMAEAMGEVFGDIIAANILKNIGYSLFDVPMQAEQEHSG